VDSNSVNVANGGAGGMYITPGTYTFTNNTISQNTGGGIGTNNGTILTLINNTFANNTTPNNGQYFGGAGLQMNGGGVPTLQNNIFFNNLFNVTKSNCAMPAGSTLGGNVSDTIAAECGTTDGTDRNSVSAVLSALADNGGPTHTMALNAGSPGVDAGVNAGCPTTDQRGYTRPVNGTCDSGAFERQ
ncbi:MAG: choice-of-anchor Q domain-containing protein, partial [Bdellovibrionota bacterium]